MICACGAFFQPTEKRTGACLACHKKAIHRAARRRQYERIKSDPEKLAQHRQWSREAEARWRAKHPERAQAARKRYAERTAAQ